MSFDRLAPHYRWMEPLLAGEKLQRCRTAFLGAIPPPRRVILLGEGTGRFLVAMLRRHPQVEVLCLDASAAMLERARGSLKSAGLSQGCVRFERQNMLEWHPKSESFDLVVSHFFLDCFPPDQLHQVVEKAASSLISGGSWLWADFNEPARGLRRCRARLILGLMYAFFRVVTKIPAGALASPEPSLREAGLTLNVRRFSEWELLRSEWWIKCAANPFLDTPPAGLRRGVNLAVVSSSMT